MHVTVRSHLTAGIAALGAGAIALTPVQPIPHHVALAQEKVVSNLAVTLASTIDPITPWVDTFKTAGANIKTLTEFYLQKPFPLLQTVVANQVTYVKELFSGNAGLIPGQIANNFTTFFKAPFSPGEVFKLTSPFFPEPVDIAKGEYLSNTETVTATGLRASSPANLMNVINQLVFSSWIQCNDSKGKEGCDLPGQVAPIANLLNTPVSGLVLGLVGPLVAPLVQVVKSFTAVGQFFREGKGMEALNELINIPAAMTNAVLNGVGFVDLTGFAEKLLPVPPGTIKSLGVNLGGLLNVVPLNGTLSDPENPPTEWSGGTALDSVAGTVGIDFGGLPVGTFGTGIGLPQFLSKAILVTPPPAPTAAVGPAAAAVVAPPAVQAAAAAAVVSEAPAVEAPAPVEAAPAVADDPDPVVIDIPAEVEAPAPQVVSSPAASKQAAASDNDGSAGSSRTGHTGARGKHAS